VHYIKETSVTRNGAENKVVEMITGVEQYPFVRCHCHFSNGFIAAIWLPAVY